MAIKAGQILHVANQFVVDRIQTGGPGDLNIPQDRVYELGNYQSVGIVRGVPDLSFNLECLDVDTEVEALLTGSVNPFADPTSTKYQLLTTQPLDITSPWKTPYGSFTAVQGVVIPNLALASASYRYGLNDNAGETFTLQGDSIYYCPGTPWQDFTVVGGTPAAAFTYAHGPALSYQESGNTFHALCVSVNGVRCTKVTDVTGMTDPTVYSETGATGITFAVAPPTGAKVSICYASSTTPHGTWPAAQTGNDAYAAGAAPANPEHLAHQTVAVKPAAIRGKDIDVYFSTSVAGVDLGAGVGVAVEVRWPDVQSATIDWSQTLESDYEFGNARAVSRDATDIPGVTGSVELRPRSVDAFFARIQQITGKSATDVIGPQSAVVGALRVEIRNPESGGSSAVPVGTVLKTHYIPDARFTIPGYSGAVQQKLNVTVNFTSDTGSLETWKGPRVRGSTPERGPHHDGGGLFCVDQGSEMFPQK